MRNRLKKLFSVICVLSACCLMLFSGCASNADDKLSDGGAQNETEQSTEQSTDKTVISYVSADSEVYSSTAEVVESVADTVVEIRTESTTMQWGMQYIVSGAGSGVIVGKFEDEYYIITNNHVIDGANDITVTLRSGITYEADLEATDDSADIAVIKIVSEAELQLAVWGNSDELKVGEDLIAIGNPLGNLGGTVTKGILSAKSRTIAVGNYAMTLLQTDTAINPGNSGGGLFNMRGQLVGVVNAKTSDEEIEGICFAIPANTARAVYNDLITHGYIVGRATFNIIVEQLSGGSSRTIVCVTDAGNSEADAFMRYDGIYSIDGKRITTVLEFNIALSEIEVGESVTVEVYRGSASQGIFGGINVSFADTLTTFTVTAAQFGI